MIDDKLWEHYYNLVQKDCVIDDFIDFAKARFLSGKISEKEYEKEIKDLEYERKKLYDRMEKERKFG